MRHGVVPTPFAPHKTRDGEVVLRRGSSCPQTGPAARRLTWTDARDVAGRLEHVQIFDTADAMAQCAGIAPESARFAPDYSPVRRDDAVPFNMRRKVPDAVPAFRDARRAAVARDAAVLTVALDGASRAAARRIAAQLVRHEVERTAPPPRWTRRRGAAGCSSDASRPASPPPPRAPRRRRASATLSRRAGDTTASVKSRRARPSTATWPPRGTRSWWSSPPRRSGCGGSWARSRRAAARRRETSSACWRAATRRGARAEPTRRSGAASAAPRRSRSSTRARARRGGHKFGVLRETVGEAAAGSVGGRARGPRAVRQTRATRPDEEDASDEALFRRRRDMAGALFEVLALGGLLPREPLEDAR